MTYRAYIEGFTGHFDNLDALKAWVLDLDARYGLKGKTCKIWKAVWVGKECAEYRSTPSREIVVGA